MSTAILSVFQSADLTIYEKSALILIRTLATEHNSVFPSYETIAAMCGMSRRKAIDVIKRLVERGLITKESRGKKAGSHLDKSNEYKASATESASHAPTKISGHAPDAPYSETDLKSYKSSLKSFKPISKTEEEDNITPAREEYLPFEYEIEKHRIPSEIRAAILDYIASFGARINDYGHKAIAHALKEAAYRLSAGRAFDNLPKWIAVTIRNKAFELSAQKADRPAWTDVLERARRATSHLR